MGVRLVAKGRDRQRLIPSPRSGESTILGRSDDYPNDRTCSELTPEAICPGPRQPCQATPATSKLLATVPSGLECSHRRKA